MSKLPSQVPAAMAVLVYDVIKLGEDRGMASLKAEFGSILDIGKEQMLSAKTGGPGFIKTKTAFGYACFGKGHYKGHAFIVLRGSKIVGDWLTNGNVGTSRSAYGQSVHDGFHRSFRTMLPRIRKFVGEFGINKIHSVHCVGHSLGGALATLCAEYVKSTSPLTPYLYTYGAPRVGLHSFAHFMTQNLKPENIHRFYHRTDIVPCIPFWPYTHIPTLMSDTYDYFLPSPGSFPSGEWHDMTKYADSVGTKSWSSLRTLKNTGLSGASVEEWLGKIEPVSFSVTNLEWLDRALSYVVKKCIQSIGGILTTAVSGAITLMDQLSYILSKGINFAEELSGLILLLIKKIMVFLGLKPVLDGVDMTQTFIRSLFQRLYEKVNNYCRQAIDDALRNQT